MPFMPMDHGGKDPAVELMTKLGSALDEFDLLYGQVMVAIYVRPKVTASGIHLPDNTVAEDLYQGKVGLLVKKGPTAFVADDKWFTGEENFRVGHDWLVIRPSDSWSFGINGVACRILDDINVRARIPRPDMVW